MMSSIALSLLGSVLIVATVVGLIATAVNALGGA